MNIEDLIYLQNPWFHDRTNIPVENNLPRRKAFPQFYRDITSVKQIISLTGLRRIGKSTLIKQVIAALLSSGTDPSTILYFSFDQPTVANDPQTIERIIEWYFATFTRKKAHGLRHSLYFFFDEIQLIPFWQDIIKRYYDINQRIKFVVSGSASLFLSQSSSESLAGRIFSRYLPPLSFTEYRLISKKSDFPEYLDYGQFPELSDFADNAKKAEYLKEGIIGKVLSIDISKIYNLRKTFDFERLFWSLLPNTGQIIYSPKLMSDLSMKKATLFKYLAILEKSLLINKVLNLSGSFRSEKRLLRKLYPASSNFLSLSVEPISIGFKVETNIASILREYGQIFLYHQRGKEIDFILPDKKIAIEVKYQNTIHPSDYKLLIEYAAEKKYRAILISKNPMKLPIKDNLTIIPAQDADEILPALLQ